MYLLLSRSSDIISGLFICKEGKNSLCPGSPLQADFFVFPDFIPDVREVICAVGSSLCYL